MLSKRSNEIAFPAILVALDIIFRLIMSSSGREFGKFSIVIEFLLLAGAIASMAFSMRNTEEEIVKNAYIFLSWVALMTKHIDFGLDMLVAFCCVQVAEYLLQDRKSITSTEKAISGYHKDWIGSLFSIVAYGAVLAMIDGFLVGADFWMVVAMILVAFVMLASLVTGKEDSSNRLFQLIAAALALILIVVWPYGASHLLWWLFMVNIGLKIQSFLTNFKLSSK